jgi:hypothetical protein
VETQRPPPDDFRDSICPPWTLESADQIRARIDDRKRHLARFNLAESTARCLDAELARAASEVAQLAVLDRWLAGLERLRDDRDDHRRPLPQGRRAGDAAAAATGEAALNRPMDSQQVTRGSTDRRKSAAEQPGCANRSIRT